MDLIRLYEYGILQVGYFRDRGNVQPIRIHAEMIPSYPDLLIDIGKLITERVANMSAVDRLIALPDSISIATVVTVMTNIPLVYQQGNDFIGAYDVGHPACLIANTINDASLESITKQGLRVGLELSHVIVLFGKSHQVNDLRVEAIFDPDAIRAALQSVSSEQLGHVEKYLGSSDF
jgi:hypothetical protein